MGRSHENDVAFTTQTFGDMKSLPTLTPLQSPQCEIKGYNLQYFFYMPSMECLSNFRPMVISNNFHKLLPFPFELEKFSGPNVGMNDRLVPFWGWIAMWDPSQPQGDKRRIPPHPTLELL